MKKILDDNRWHASEYPDTLLKAGYIEWKYFNFTSPDCSGIVLYLVTDPMNRTGLGGGRVIARIFSQEGVFGGSLQFPMSDVALSEKDAGITIGENAITADGERYGIRGTVASVVWNLEYVPDSLPIEGFSDLNLDPLGVQKASWFITMPRAKVRGVVSVGRRRYAIDAYGYSDTNWGSLFPLVSQFNWMQYNDEVISVAIGEMQNLEIKNKKVGRWGGIYISYRGERTVFEKKDFSMEHLQWKIVPGTKIKVPFITLVEGENKNFQLSLILKTEISDPLHFRMPPPLPVRPVVVEQTAQFYGELFRKGDKTTASSYSFSGKGFKEYSLRYASLGDRVKTGIVI